MARPGLTKHRKFLRLARLLQSQIMAMGALELMWQRAYEHGPDLGDPLDVEFGVGWTGEPGRLAAALVDAGFLDAAEDGTLRVHDLDDHAPAYYRKRKAREASRRVTVSSVTSQRPVGDAQTAALPTPTPNTHTHTRTQDLARVQPAEVPNCEAYAEAWRDAAAAAGTELRLGLKPAEVQHLMTVAEAYGLDEFAAAARVWWQSAHTGGRNLGLFVSQLDEVLGHLRSGATHAFRAPPPPGPKVARFDPAAWAAKGAS